jgi:hypothetical protein
LYSWLKTKLVAAMGVRFRQIKVGFVGLAADHFRQMLEEMAHAVTLGEIIAEI